jgi:hypothetical protein
LRSSDRQVRLAVQLVLIPIGFTTQSSRAPRFREQGRANDQFSDIIAPL